jgi:sterol desaturase/sphingolipid hydroxylase (fatty acid hydroxylase superfamily)
MMDDLIADFGYVTSLLIVTSIVFILYLVFSGILYTTLCVLKRRNNHKRIQNNQSKAIKIQNEIRHSFSSAIVFGIIGLITMMLKDNGFTKMYTNLNDFGIFYFFGSILIMLLIHDTYFYWMHRAIHHPKLFAVFHRIHHLSRNPTPFSAFSFDIAEAIAEAAIIPILVMLLPIHPLAVFIFFTISLMFNIVYHSGYEFLPPWFLKHPVLKWINTSTHHNMHHEKGHGNYSLYFNFWDTLMKTNHKHYHKRFYEITRSNKNTVIVKLLIF